MGFREFVAARKAKETEEMASKARALGCGLASGASDDIGRGDLSDEGTRLFRNFDAEQGRLAKRCYWRVLFKPRVAIRAKPSVEAAIVGGADGGALIAAREAEASSRHRGRRLQGTWVKAVDAKGWICCDPTGTKVAHLGLLLRAEPGTTPEVTEARPVPAAAVAPAPFGAGRALLVTRARGRVAWRGSDAPRVKAGFVAEPVDGKSGRTRVDEGRCLVVLLAGAESSEDAAVALCGANDHVAVCLLREARDGQREGGTTTSWPAFVDAVADEVARAAGDATDVWRDAAAESWRAPSHVVFGHDAKRERSAHEPCPRALPPSACP